MSTNEFRELGRRLRAFRQARGLSLAQVAHATSISASFLSHVENGKSDISFSRLSRLVELYGVAMVDLVPPTHSDAQVVRASDRKQIASHVKHVEVFQLSPGTDVPMRPLLCVFEPSTDTGYGTPGCDEFIHVIAGELEVEFERGDRFRLKRGDSAYFGNEHAARAYRNVGRGVSTHISVLQAARPPTREA